MAVHLHKWDHAKGRYSAQEPLDHLQIVTQTADSLLRVTRLHIKRPQAYLVNVIQAGKLHQQVYWGCTRWDAA